ncbi:helix-turn-helix domain-containing protein [Vreelandella zhanjiangensis]|uniref:helix-turn-helix domain-containing protein n=1 Tax=Vreelandella zhanjiangensis TaxID=1121960 RepID=UPI00402A9F06
MYGDELANKLEAILASGATYKAVAERAQCDSSTVYRIRTGAIANPSYSVGRAIDEMHAAISKKAAA